MTCPPPSHLSEVLNLSPLSPLVRQLLAQCCHLHTQQQQPRCRNLKTHSSHLRPHSTHLRAQLLAIACNHVKLTQLYHKASLTGIRGLQREGGGEGGAQGQGEETYKATTWRAPCPHGDKCWRIRVRSRVQYLQPVLR